MTFWAGFGTAGFLAVVVRTAAGRCAGFRAAGLFGVEATLPAETAAGAVSTVVPGTASGVVAITSAGTYWISTGEFCSAGASAADFELLVGSAAESEVAGFFRAGFFPVDLLEAGFFAAGFFPADSFPADCSAFDEATSWFRPAGRAEPDSESEPESGDASAFERSSVSGTSLTA